MTALHFAAWRGDTEAIIALVDAGADPNVEDSEGNTPLHRAVERGQTEAITVLVDAGADPDARGGGRLAPLHWAAERGDTGVLTALLEAGAGPWPKNFDGDTPLHFVAWRGDTEAITALLGAGANPNAISSRGTPLHRAAERGHAEAITVLLGGGTDPNARDSEGFTPLHWVAARGDTEAITVLLTAGAHANAKSVQGFNALHRAVDSGDIEALTVLLGAGADPNAISSRGTPLHRAVERCHAEAIAVLLEAGADPDARDSGRRAVRDKRPVRDKLPDARWPNEWSLLSVKEESPFPIRLVLRDSLYYAASGFDGKPIRYLGGKILSFVYVDCGLTRSKLFAELYSRGLRGYDVVASRSICERELAPQGWLTPSLERHGGSLVRGRFPIDFDWREDPFCEWLLFQRREEFPAYHGPPRLSLLYLCAEGVAAFHALYIANSIAPKVVAVIQPGRGFGGNPYDFEDPRKIFARSVLENPAGQPDFLLHGGWGGGYREPCWPEYSENVCFFGRSRRLGLWARKGSRYDGR